MELDAGMKRNVSKLSAYALFWDEDYWDCYIVLFSLYGVRVGCIEVAGGGCGVVASWLLLLLSLLGALSSNRDLGMTGLCVLLGCSHQRGIPVT
jgi:hypothetical protein